MDDGEFAVPCDCYTYFACHYLVWCKSPGGYLRSIDGDWSILWAIVGDHRQSDP